MKTRWSSARLGAAALAVAAAGAQISAAQPAAVSAATAQRIGRQAHAVRARAAIVPIVVIVPDARSYVAAISAWTPERRFPVLIDDGSWAGREDIGRFVRAFNPEQCVSWAAPEGPPLPPAGPERQATIEAAHRTVWAAADGAALLAAFKRHQTMPGGGIVAMNAGDPAWTGGLALAAARGQLIAWVSAPGNLSGQLTMAQAVELSTQIGAAATAAGATWNALGDDIDAVTVALNCPGRVDVLVPRTPPSDPIGKLFAGKQGEALAMTDVVPRNDGGRWAWAGHVFGAEGRSAYNAMCALFLTAGDAVLFDGYETTKPWSDYDLTTTAQVLEKFGLKTRVFDTPRQSLGEWRTLTAGGLKTDLLFINSMGVYWHFDLKPGQGRAGDVPILHRPAIVNMVHSWSAWSPGNRLSIGGRFIEHGAYAYAGSVHEPYLQAFVPPPVVAGRLCAGWPLGAAIRLDEAPAWRVAMIGDPLLTLGPAGPRADATLPLKDATPMTAAATGASPELLWTLVMSGKDADAVARLQQLIGDGKGPAPTAATAKAVIMAAFRAGDIDAFCAAYRPLIGELDAMPGLRDAAWQLLWPRGRALTKPQLALLAVSLRDDQPRRDAADLYDLLAAAEGRDAARAVIQRLRDQAKAESVRKELGELLTTISR